jgi:tetratricopeptide (TPR) repeat protein
MSPVVFDSDIVILHCPQNAHAQRDFKHFQKAFAKQGALSNKLLSMYARELYIAGEDSDFEQARECFEVMLKAGTNLPEDLRKACECVLAHCARCRGDVRGLMTMSLHNVADNKASSEMCYELGLFYASVSDWDEAYVWFLNAAYETQSVCNIHYGGDWALERLAECAEQLGDKSMASEYARLAKEWELPRG